MTVTHQELLAEAQRLAALDGHHYANLTPAERIDYSRRAAVLLRPEGPGFDPTGELVAVTASEREAAVSAASQAASLQRMLDRHHLHTRVIVTDMGPAVLWSSVEEVMPLPDEAAQTH